MATPGLGYRRALDVLMEVSLHLLEPVVSTTVLAVTAGGYGDGFYGGSSTPPTYGYGDGPPVVLQLGSSNYLYPGAMIVIGWGLPTAEVVTVLTVQSGGYISTTALVNSHTAGELVLAPTFPTQQPTDPIYTQTEVLTYLARAQNNFLQRVPMTLEFFRNQLLPQGTQYQATPDTLIELERVAIQVTTNDLPIATIQRTGGTVTAGLSLASSYTPELAILVQGVSDPSFNSANNQTFSLATVSSDGLTLTWAQTGADTGSIAGAGATTSLPVVQRLYESNQNQIAMRDPYWQVNSTGAAPQSWYEDRTGTYQWGVAPLPANPFYAELLGSIRDTTTLGLLDGFLVPDPWVQYLKWGVVAACLSKDGEQRSPTQAKFAQGKMDFGVMLADRFLRNLSTEAGVDVFAAASGSINLG